MNTFQFQAHWARRVQNMHFGFNTDPRTNRIDEYEHYNAIRRDLYARQDMRFKWIQSRLALMLVIVIVAGLALK